MPANRNQRYGVRANSPVAQLIVATQSCYDKRCLSWCFFCWLLTDTAIKTLHRILSVPHRKRTYNVYGAQINASIPKTKILASVLVCKYASHYCWWLLHTGRMTPIQLRSQGANIIFHVIFFPNSRPQTTNKLSRVSYRSQRNIKYRERDAHKNARNLYARAIRSFALSEHHACASAARVTRILRFKNRMQHKLKARTEKLACLFIF